MANQLAPVTQLETASPTLLSSLSPRFRTKPRYSETGEFLGEDVVSFDASNLEGKELEVVRAEIDRALAPLSRNEIIQEISLLRTVLKARAEQGSDLKAMLLIYAQDLADVPGMALKAAILEIRRTETFFPTLAEIRDLAESKCRRARVAKLAIDRGSAGRVIAKVQRMTDADAKFSRMFDQSKNWPDPAERKAVKLKALPVHNPETARLIAEAKALQTPKEDGEAA